MRRRDATKEVGLSLLRPRRGRELNRAREILVSSGDEQCSRDRNPGRQRTPLQVDRKDFMSFAPFACNLLRWRSTTAADLMVATRGDRGSPLQGRPAGRTRLLHIRQSYGRAGRERERYRLSTVRR